MTQDFKLGATEAAFLHPLDVVKVSLDIFGIDYNVIQVPHTAVSQAAPEHLSHEPLEGG